jgi:hypothetical protein
MLQRMVAGLWRAGGCTGARTCGPRRAGSCTRTRKKLARGTRGAARCGVAAARRASVQAKLSSRQHGAPAGQSVWEFGDDGQRATYKVFEPLLELLAVVALGNAVLDAAALSQVRDLCPVFVGVGRGGEG